MNYGWVLEIGRRGKYNLDGCVAGRLKRIAPFSVRVRGSNVKLHVLRLFIFFRATSNESLQPPTDFISKIKNEMRISLQ